jgi:hypothetical protein
VGTGPAAAACNASISSNKGVKMATLRPRSGFARVDSAPTDRKTPL